MPHTPNEFTLSVTDNTGSVFSKFMILIQNLALINPDFNKTYLLNKDNRSLTGENNIFNSLFDQTPYNDHEIPSTRKVKTYTSTNRIEKSKNLDTYKKIVSKLKFSKDFLEEYHKHANELKVDNTFLGVHLRLTDANLYHAYSNNSYNDFLLKIKQHKQPNQKIFVASDNNESLIKLQKEFGDDLVFVKDFIRGKTEIEDTYKTIFLPYLKDKKLWVEAFIEMLLLSKCGTLICRSSNVNNASIIYSNTLKKIIRI
jgi:hypothetical protein